MKHVMNAGLVSGIAAGLMVIATCAAPALAVTAPGHDSAYVGAGFSYELPDSGRHSDNGIGFRAGGGIPLDAFGIPQTALEANFFGTRRSRDIDGKDDYQDALLFDLVHDFGLFGWGDQSWLPDFKPFVLGGVGAVYDDAHGDSSWNPMLDVGVGLLFPLHWHGVALRTAFRVLGQHNDTSVPSKDFLFDFHFGIGIQIPLDFLNFNEAPQPQSEPPVKIVPVVPEQPAAGASGSK